MRKLLILSAISCLLSQGYAKEYPIQATMIIPQMQNHEYQVENIDQDNYLGTLTCTNGTKAKLYHKKDIYVGTDEGWDAKAMIRFSILGDIVAKAIESDSVFVGGNTSWPIVVGTEVAKEGIIKYSEKNDIDPDKKENALNVTAGISTGSSIANLVIAAGATNPVGIFVGLVGGVIAYNQATKQYELQKLNAGKARVLTFIDHPLDSQRAYACE